MENPSERPSTRRRSPCFHTTTRTKSVWISRRGSRGWKDDILADKNFDFSKRFLPNRLTGVDEIGCLNENEKLQLNQIMGNGYCHIFAFVEEFIIPAVTEEAMKDVYGDEVRARSFVAVRRGRVQASGAVSQIG